MTHLPGNYSQPPVLHRRNPDPPWLWLALMGGSIVVHGLFIASSLPLLDRIAAPPLEDASIPIDIVELSPESSANETTLAPSASTDSASTSVPAVSSAPPAPAPDAIGLTGDVAVLSPSLPPDPSAPFISPETVPPSPEVVPPSPNPSPEPFIAPSTALPSLEPANPNIPPAASPVPEATPNEAVTPLPSASPTPPGFATSRINVPIPDVSERLTLPDATVDPNSLAQTGINQTATPLQLIANLTIDRFADATEQPETIATPVDDITSQEISDPKTSACLSALQPAILPALGTAVVLQIDTDETGQVTQTTVQQSSQNAAYDALAQCALEHWRFNPATDQGVPVASNALQIRVTIDPK